MTQKTNKFVRIVFFCIIFILYGCGNQNRNDDVELFQHPKIIAMRSIVQSMASNSITREKAWRGMPPLQIDYSISIEPRVLSVSDNRDSGSNFLGLGIPGKLEFHISPETIDRSKVAVLFEAILGADHSLNTSTVLFTWENGHWVSQSDIYINAIGNADPQNAAELRRLDAEMDKILDEKRKLNAASMP